MPSHSRNVKIELEEAILLADFYGIRFDLAEVARLCRKVIDLGRIAPRDYTVEEGLVTAAIIRYGRCFTKGLRFWLGARDLAELDIETLADHNYFLALRNKFVAHAVNAFEEAYVTVTATNRDGQLLPISSVHPGQHRVLLTAETAEALLPVVDRVTAIVEKRVSMEETALLLVIQSLPLETIHSGDLHMPKGMGVEHVQKSRPRGAHVRKRIE